MAGSAKTFGPDSAKHQNHVPQKFSRRPALNPKSGARKITGRRSLAQLKIKFSGPFNGKFFTAKRLCLFLLQIFAKGLNRNALPQLAQAAKLLAGLGLHAVIHPVNNLAKALALVKAN